MTDWLSRWENNNIGWHADEVNLQLIERLSELNLVTGDKVFIPLCGKSNDMIYLLGRGFSVVGVEMSKIAVEQFFLENNLSYKEAEKNKKLKGIDAFKIDETENNQSPINIEKKTIYNNLIEEIRKTLRFYMKNNNQSFFNTFYLSGGCSKIYKIDKTIAENLNVKVEIANPFKKINNTKSLDNPSQFSIAVGLALRGLNK